MKRKLNSDSVPIGVALVGSGRIGAVHARNIMANHRLRLKYVVDVNLEAATSWASKAPGAKGVATIEEALRDEEVKGVVICTPSATHKELILKALRAGRPVMCEKPISLDLAEIDECYNEAKKLGVPLLCGYQRRYDPSFRQLQEQVRKGSVGQVQIVKTVSRDHPVPTLAYLKISGKIFHDCGSHDIDVGRWITGEDPYEVFATATAFNPDIKALNDWDTVLITLKYPSGIIGSIDLSRKAVYGYDQRIEVLGDKGMLQAENREKTTMVLSNETGVRHDPYLYSFPQRYEHAYALELEHFVEILLGNAEPELTHDDARKVSIIADAAEKSAETGRPVTIKYN